MRLAEAIDHKHAVVFFDGQCGLCHHTVRFILEHDQDARYYFIPLQSEGAQSFLEAEGASDLEALDTLYVYQDGGLYDRSRAVAKIFRTLRGLDFQIMGYFMLLYPRCLTDWCYRLISRYRHRIPFIATASCQLPEESDRMRFLEEAG